MEPENALEHMASIDLIELCNEAKIERCRATRDLSSCGRYVQHVLNSCGHASLCAECSQRCDVCPICRTFLPTTGSKSRLRLYYKCIEAGLISKRYDDRFQEKKEGGEHSVADIQRLYSLFDVALENNLVSLICHYVTDVCMDESAVSSDPVLAFLLDEVVVKDWCKKKFRKIILDLRGIYILKTETMKTKLEMLQKFVSQLTGIASVLEVMDTSFREAVSAQLRDLHQLLENTLKTKQHLEVMIWCIQNQFLEGVQSRYPNSASWNILVRERKSAAVKRSWPDVTSNLAAPEASLFIEQALSNLGIEQSCNQDIEEELDISCLKDNNSPVLFLSKIDEWNTSRREGCYPFGNLRAATDVLFLHGTSDMVVAKQAIFLYYLFDRQWTRPDSEWRYLVDDFAAFFGITRHSLLESLAFYLLDDNSDLTLQEASILLPEIACAETHPKIAQVLLERQRPDVALTVLRCTGRDGCGYANSEPFSLVEAVTAVRVKIECGLLTEAFMYQRMHCSKMKEHNIKHGPFTASSDSSTSDSWKNHVEVLVSEICHLCSRRNLVDRIIELPWNSDEEKYILKCLYDYACQDPCTVHGSLLVVFYLQRCRYTEAYQVDRKLQILEQNNMETANEEVATRIKSMSHWRTALVDKSINLLPDVERKQVMKGNAMDSELFSLHNVRPPLNEDLSSEPQKHAALPSSSSMKSPLILQKNLHSFVTKKASPNAHTNLSSPTGGPTSELGSKGPSVIQQRLLNTSGSPSSYQINTLAGRISSSNSNSREHSPSNGTLSKHLRQQDGVGKGYQSVGLSLPTSSRFVLQSTPQKEANNSKSRVLENANLFQGEQSLFQMEPNDFAGPADTFHSYLTTVNPEAPKDIIKTPHSNGFFKNSLRDQSSTIAGKRMLNRSSTNVPSEEGNMSSTLSLLQKGSPAEEQDMKGLSRWRSDESSDDEEEDHGLQNYRAGRTPFMIPRGTKHTWR